jgi:hypothetical protein
MGSQFAKSNEIQRKSKEIQWKPMKSKEKFDFTKKTKKTIEKG